MRNMHIIQTRETVYLDFAKAALVAIMLTMAALVTGCGAPLEPEEHFAELGDAGELQLGTAEQAAGSATPRATTVQRLRASASR